MEQHFEQMKQDRGLLDEWEPLSDSDREEANHEAGTSQRGCLAAQLTGQSRRATSGTRHGEEAARNEVNPIDDRKRKYHTLQMAGLQELERLRAEQDDQKGYEEGIMSSPNSTRLRKHRTEGSDEGVRSKRSKRMVG